VAEHTTEPQTVRTDQLQSPNDPEEISREIIIRGMELYKYMKQELAGQINEDLEDAFLMHITLMIHRIYFDKEYDEFIQAKDHMSESFKKVKNLLKRFGLKVHRSEIQA